MAVCAVLLLGCATTGEPVQPSHTEARPLTEPLQQTFVPAGDRLSTVAVLVATYGVNGPDGVLRMNLAGAGQQREAFVELSEVDDGTWVRLVVPPIEQAAGERFTATFRYEGRQPVALLANPHDPYAQGQLRPGGGDLAFEIGHAGRLAGLIGALRRIAGDFGANLARDPLFATLWAVSLLAGTALFAAAVRSERRTRAAGTGQRSTATGERAHR